MHFQFHIYAVDRFLRSCSKNTLVGIQTQGFKGVDWQHTAVTLIGNLCTRRVNNHQMNPSQLELNYMPV